MESPDRNARELLAFYRDSGVDTLLGEAPVDRFADDLRVGSGSAAKEAGR